MPGAAFLATGAALRSGCGLVTLHSTEMAVAAASSRFPSAVFSIDDGAYFSNIPVGVWLHGYAGDLLTEECSAEAYDSFDLISCLKDGFWESFTALNCNSKILAIPNFIRLELATF